MELGAEGAIRLYLARSFPAEIRDEVATWILLNRYLKFDQTKIMETQKCIAAVLKDLTGMDLERVSRLPYNGDKDLFDEINEIVGDPRKARLLDGLKRASRNDAEMSRMLKSLNRWLKRSSDETRRVIFAAAYVESIKNIPTGQLHEVMVGLHTIRMVQEVAKLFTFYDALEKDKPLHQESLPLSFPNRDHLLELLTRLGSETNGYRGCRAAIVHALKTLEHDVNWERVLECNVSVMRELSTLPDESFWGVKEME